MTDRKQWCPQHGYPLPCDKCGLKSYVEIECPTCYGRGSIPKELSQPVPPVEPDLLTQLRRKLQQIEYCRQNCNQTVASCFQKWKRCKTIFNEEVKDPKSWVNVMTNQILEEVQPLLTANEAKIRELEKELETQTRIVEKFDNWFTEHAIQP